LTDSLSERAYFLDSFAKFRVALEVARKVSKWVGKRFVGPDLAHASFILFKVVLVADSIRKIAEQEVPMTRHQLDHFSIASLTRDLMEATIMLSYLTEPGISESTARLRRIVLNLHDCTTRHRMFKAWRNTPGMNARHNLKGFKADIDEQRAELQGHSEFQSLDPEVQTKLLSGTQLYVGGLRGAVRSMGWEKGDFDGAYAYLSAYTHTAPVAFYRMEDKDPSSEEPSSFQYGLAALALEWATACIDKSVDRARVRFPDPPTIMAQ
jgi:hypothetical protein